MTTLLLDIGNSRVKWCLAPVAAHHAERSSGSVSRAALDELRENIGAIHFERVLISSVARSEFNRSLIDSLHGIKSRPIEFAVTQARSPLVKPAYSAAKDLGVDRWLAMSAAYNDCLGECCVLDAGSAITIDWVSASGGHVGGLIQVGLGKLMSALNFDAKHIHAQGRELPLSWRPGASTQACVDNGLGMQVQAVVREVERHCLERKSTIYITGGDARVFEQYFSVRVKQCSDLVLDGLRLYDELIVRAK